jgi:hypothetical protein
MLGNSAVFHLAEQQASEQLDGHFDLQRVAARRFWRLFAGGLWRRVMALAGRRTPALRSLRQASQEANGSGSRYLGTLAVPIEQIGGSEGKVDEFDASFRPLKPMNRDRWVSVAVAFLQGKTLPPVELIKIGQQYFVRDGHHRISVARAYGQYDVDAVVTVWNAQTM